MQDTAQSLDEGDSGGKVLLYIDNSNIFINTKQHSLLIQSSNQDFKSRVDVGRLVEKARAGREVLCGKLYGSEPPALDSVWQAIRDKKIQVFTSKRSDWTNKEKQTDTDLVAEAVEDIIINKKEASGSSAVILFTGDKDMLQVVRKAIKHGWNVEIWSYKASLSHEMIRESESTKKVSINLIDDCFDQLTFSVAHWNPCNRIPRERSIVLRFDKEDGHLSSPHTFIKDVVKEADEVFRVPTLGCFTSDTKLDVVLIFPATTKRDNSVFYDFNQTIWKNINHLKERLADCQSIVTYIEYRQQMHAIDWDAFEEIQSDEEVDVDDPDFADASFEIVRPRTKKHSQLYSEVCLLRYRCQKGLACRYSHQSKERDYFKEQPNPKSRFVYKTKLCPRANHCKYLSSPHLCSFAHDRKEARCIRCQEIGHWTDECQLPS